MIPPSVMRRLVFFFFRGKARDCSIWGQADLRRELPHVLHLREQVQDSSDLYGVEEVLERRNEHGKGCLPHFAPFSRCLIIDLMLPSPGVDL